LVFAEDFVGVLYHYRRESRAAEENAERLLVLSTEHGFSLWLAFGTSLRGVAMAGQGRYGEGIGLIQDSLAAVRETGSEMGRPYNLNQLADAFIHTGRLDEGSAL
jgi:hypothetical protein